MFNNNNEKIVTNIVVKKSTEIDSKSNYIRITHKALTKANQLR